LRCRVVAVFIERLVDQVVEADRLVEAGDRY
jgi:hypothetical protein